MIINIILLIIGFVMLIKGADYFVDGASALAARLKIPAIIIGLTVVAMGTSAPEAAVSITSALQGSNAIAIGNVIGSNIANILLILGLSACAAKLSVQKNTFMYEMPFTAFITLLLCFIGGRFGIISTGAAFGLLVLFVAFLGYLFVISRNSKDANTEIKNINILKIIIFIALGLAALIFGSKIAVSASINIARIIGISERIIGLTIVAFGTSLPELVTSVIAARKGETDIAIGNIIGSNIFNILFVLGISGVILPIPFHSAFLFDGAIAILAVVMLMLATLRNKCLNRTAGIIFIAVYVAYLSSLIVGK